LPIYLSIYLSVYLKGVWATLLCGWEEKTAMLPPAGARIETIQEEIEEIMVRGWEL